MHMSKIEISVGGGSRSYRGGRIGDEGGGGDGEGRRRKVGNRRQLRGCSDGASDDRVWLVMSRFLLLVTIYLTCCHSASI